MDFTIVITIWDFLVSTGIIFVVLGSIITMIISRVALIPTLKKVKAILDVFIEKAEDGEITPEEVKVIWKVIEAQIGSDFWLKLFGFMFKQPSETEIKELTRN